MTEPDSARLARLVAEFGEQTTAAAVMDRIVASAATQIPGAEDAGITLVERGRVSTPAATSELVLRVDEIQYETREGPCLSVLGDEPLIQVDDLLEDTRWPRFSPQVAALGVRSMLSFHLQAQRRVLGALNLYATQPGAFNAQSDAFGMVLSAHAAVVLALITKVDNLSIAVQSRDVIGQAKGILMERYRLTDQQAFDLLVSASQATNTRVHEVATHLADTGELKGLD